MGVIFDSEFHVYSWIYMPALVGLQSDLEVAGATEEARTVAELIENLQAQDNSNHVGNQPCDYQCNGDLVDELKAIDTTIASDNTGVRKAISRYKETVKSRAEELRDEGCSLQLDERMIVLLDDEQHRSNTVNPVVSKVIAECSVQLAVT